jgi:hypothetical protein
LDGDSFFCGSRLLRSPADLLRCHHLP